MILPSPLVIIITNKNLKESFDGAEYIWILDSGDSEWDEHCRCRAGAFRLGDEAQWQIASIIDICLLRALGRRVQRLVCPRSLREKARLWHVLRVSVCPQHARDACTKAGPDISTGARDPSALLRRQIQLVMHAGFVVNGGKEKRAQVQHAASGTFLLGPW